MPTLQRRVVGRAAGAAKTAFPRGAWEREDANENLHLNTDSRKYTGESSAPRLEVVIEIPRGSIFKRGSNGVLDFISPLPCPYNYGSVPTYLGLEGDLLDALVLGPRLNAGTRVMVYAYGAVGMADRGLYDDKLICSTKPPTALQRSLVILFFRFYGRCKGLLNLLRRQPGRTAYEGWFEAPDAIARAEPLRRKEWSGSQVSF